MAGGFHTRRQQDRDRTLADRVHPPGETTLPDRVPDERAGSRSGADPNEPAERGPPAEPRPCWIRWPREPTPGHVLRWRQDSDGTWWALVVAMLPQDAVRPRRDSRPPGG